jgi:hypothetical protein
VGLVPKHGCLLTLPYYVFPTWYQFGERRWNSILTGENRRTRRKTCPSATLSTTNPTWIDPGANSGLRGERPATNDLRHGTALSYTLVDAFETTNSSVLTWRSFRTVWLEITSLNSSEIPLWCIPVFLHCLSFQPGAPAEVQDAPTPNVFYPLSPSALHQSSPICKLQVVSSLTC